MRNKSCAGYIHTSREFSQTHTTSVSAESRYPRHVIRPFTYFSSIEETIRRLQLHCYVIALVRTISFFQITAGC